MRCPQLRPQTGGHLGVDHATVQHGDAGAAQHGFKMVLLHEGNQRTPQSHDHRALAVIRVDTAATKLHHTWAQAAQAHQVKLSVGIGAAHARRLCWHQHPVGAHHRPVNAGAHQQVFAIVIKDVDVVPGQGTGNVGAPLVGKHLVAQSLRFAHLIQMPGPLNGDLGMGGGWRRWGGGLLTPMGDRISWPPSGCDGVCELYRPDRHERSICFMQRSV